MDEDTLGRMEDLVEELERRIGEHRVLERLAHRQTPPSSLRILHWAWQQMSREERLHFLSEHGNEEQEPHG